MTALGPSLLVGDEQQVVLGLYLGVNWVTSLVTLGGGSGGKMVKTLGEG